MSSTCVAVLITGALAGGALTVLLTLHGLRQLTAGDRAGLSLKLAAVGAGCAAGSAAVIASDQAGAWDLLPALLLWASALVAASICDAVSQRIPTALVRQATLATTALLIAGLSAQRDWRGLVVSGAAATTAGLLLLLCWHLAGFGFGDVRLAILGGLGLGHTTLHGVAVGTVAFSAVILVQAGAALARRRNRQTMLPLGPALAMSFLLASTF